MVFPVPALNIYAGGDTNYIDKFNTDNTQLRTAFAGLVSDINAVTLATGTSTWEDWTRKGPPAEAWPDGVLGAYSLVLDTSDIGSGDLLLTTTNASGVSIAVIAGDRRTHAGTLTLALSTLALGDGPHDVFFGVTPSGTVALLAQASTTQSSVTLPLYSVPITVSGTGTVFAITTNSTPTRMPKTVYWDNTVEQLRQETPQVIVLNHGWDAGSGAGVMNSAATTTAFSDQTFVIPYDHYFEGATVTCDSIANTPVISWSIQRKSDSDIIVQGTLANVLEVSLTVDPAYENNVALAAGTAYTVLINRTVGTVTKATISIFVRRAYNAPLAN